jgi:hypothetical protein
VCVCVCVCVCVRARARVCVFGGVSILICTNMMQRNHVGPQHAEVIRLAFTIAS